MFKTQVEPFPSDALRIMFCMFDTFSCVLQEQNDTSITSAENRLIFIDEFINYMFPIGVLIPRLPLHFLFPAQDVIIRAVTKRRTNDVTLNFLIMLYFILGST